MINKNNKNKYKIKFISRTIVLRFHKKKMYAEKRNYSFRVSTFSNHCQNGNER